MKRFLNFTRDILVQGIGFMIVPWTLAAYLAFELYAAFKRNMGFDDLGLGWPAIALALMLTVGSWLFGHRFQRIYDRHFGEG